MTSTDGTGRAVRVAAFDFELPRERIALRPVVPRDAARLLVVDPGREPQFSDRGFGGIGQLLRPGDVLVCNDTRVIHARLRGRRQRGESSAAIEIMLHQRLDGSRWRAFARPAKRLQEGDLIQFGHEGRVCLAGTLAAGVEEKGEAGEVTLAFQFHGPVLDEAIATLGEMPLPPYIASQRPADEADENDYQTVFASKEGAVAAPTAGLHFTPSLLARLREQGIAEEFLTLHVGAGTFLPVQGEDTGGHRMHAEWGEIGAETARRLNEARAAGGRIVAVGTTALRLLESAADEGGTVHPFSGLTDIFITPGHRFRAVDRLMTNFHLPRSTLFMLVSAFPGLARMKAAYAHAIDNGYRFYSYGDACFLEPEDRP